MRWPDKIASLDVKAFICALLKSSHVLVEHGVLLANARILSAYQSTDAVKEAANLVECLFNDLDRQVKRRVKTVSVLCLGLEAVEVGNMLKLMCPRGSDPSRAKLVLQKSSHPAWIAREYGSETGVLDSAVAMSRALAKMVKSVSEHNIVSHQQDSGDEYLCRDAVWDNLDICPWTSPTEDSCLCTYKNWFARPAGCHDRSFLDLPLSMRSMQRLLRFRMGCHKLPRDTGCWLRVQKQILYIVPAGCLRR